jgi:hypothetical protein
MDIGALPAAGAAATVCARLEAVTTISTRTPGATAITRSNFLDSYFRRRSAARVSR